MAKQRVELNGREVIDLRVTGALYEDAYFSEGFYADTGDALEDSELDELAELRNDVLEDMALNNAIMAAEYAFDGDR